jgi:hypothetical protein
MLTFATSFFDMVFSVFCIFAAFFYPQLMSFGGFVIWIAYYMVNIGLIMYEGQTVKNEGAETINLVNKALNFATDKRLIEKLSKMSQQLVHRVPKFSSAIFTFDLVLFHSVSLAQYQIV